jgi:hypothetical protein
METRRVWGWSASPIAWALVRCRVPYAAIGGVAVAAHTGWGRPQDFDIVVLSTAPAERRLVRAIELLVSRWGLHPDAPTLCLRDGQFMDRVGTVLHLSVGTLDIMGEPLAGAFDFDAIIARRRWRIVDRAPVAVACSADVDALKGGAGPR